MTQEEKQMMNDGVPDTDEHIEAKAAVTCFLMFIIGAIVLGVVLGAIEIVKSIF